jgi:hypothetical protein
LKEGEVGFPFPSVDELGVPPSYQLKKIYTLSSMLGEFRTATIVELIYLVIRSRDV